MPGRVTRSRSASIAATASPPSAPDRRDDDVAGHLDAWRALVARGDAGRARGALVLAAVAALGIASSRSSTGFAHEVKVRRLRHALSGFDPALRPHLAALMEAALAREAEERIEAGLAPHGRRLRGWLTDLQGEGGEPVSGGAAGPPASSYPTTAALARYAEAAAAEDVDVALSAAIAIVGEMIGRVRRGELVEAALDALERTGLSLCVPPATDRAERDDARRTLVILALILRRRRPLVAAMVRHRLALHRRIRGG
jgi:hypothetical protein